MQREELRAIVRTMYDLQDVRKKMGNRKMIKVDHTAQKDNGTKRPKTNDLKVRNYVNNSFDYSEKAEDSMKEAIAKEVENYSIWKDFLKNVKGCGPLMAAVIICEIDITKAPYRSCLCQFAGMNPGLVRGKKRVGDKVSITDDMIRGDRKTKGYLSPYNAFLKTKMLGVLADCFIKSKSPYTKFYYDYKNRLDCEPAWKDESKLHKDRAAKRYMMKMFLGDLYEKWRTLEGLEVRCPYEEEYLNIKHHDREERA